MRFKEALKIAGFIVLCLLAGIIGSLFTTTGAGSWYSELVKPSFNPPNWVFGPVWTTLYILMGISLYLAVRNKVSNNGIYFFAAQLVLNTLWSIFFFGLENPLLALIEIIVLWAFILLTIVEFHRKSRVAAYLLIPYLLWVSFASVLNLYLWMLN